MDRDSADRPTSLTGKHASELPTVPGLDMPLRLWYEPLPSGRPDDPAHTDPDVVEASQPHIE